MRKLLWSTIVLLLASTGCGVDIEPPYLVNRVKVLAIVAEPPEIHPGEHSALTAWVAAPGWDARQLRVEWSYCPKRSSIQNEIGCDKGVTLASRGLFTSGRGVLHTETRHGFDVEQAEAIPSLVLQAGFWEHVRVRVEGDEQDEEAIKRVVVVADDVAPNINPELHAVEVHQGEHLLQAPLRAAAGSTLSLRPLYDEEGFSSYRVISRDGVLEQRKEAPQLTWYVTGGELSSWQSTSARPVSWTLPKEPGHLQFFVVLRDGRGGTAVQFGEIEVL